MGVPTQPAFCCFGVEELAGNQSLFPTNYGAARTFAAESLGFRRDLYLLLPTQRLQIYLASFVIVLVPPRHVVSVVTPLISIITLLPISGIFIPSLLLKGRAAGSAKLRGIPPQASHDSLRIRDLRSAQAPDVGRAGDLLFPCSPILLRDGCTVNHNAAATQYHRKPEQDLMRSHNYPFVSTQRPKAAQSASPYV